MVFWPENCSELVQMYNGCLDNSIQVLLLGYGSNVH